MDILEQVGRQFLITLGYTVMGLLAFGIAFAVIVRVTPFSIKKEIEDDQNVAFAVVIAAVIIGIALIVAATVHGCRRSPAPARAAVVLERAADRGVRARVRAARRVR